MNITFLLGNGFDRALGLETGYGAFYKWYCAKSKQGLTDWICAFRDEIDKYVHKDPSAEAYWSDAEYGLGQYSEKFTLETVDHFIDCFEDFRDNLVEYLVEEQSLMSIELAAKMKTHFASQLVNFYQEIDPIERNDVITCRNQGTAREFNLQLVCFNYTNAVDQVAGAFGTDSLGVWRGTDGNQHSLKMGKLFHAHGTLDLYPIIGVCNELSIKNQELLKSPVFKAAMQKSRSITVAGQLWRSEVKDIIKNSQILCIFGMSLGETDSDYWEMVTEWLSGDSKRQLVIFWYDVNATKLNLAIPQKYREVTKVKRKLLDYSEWTEEKFAIYEKRIHVVLKPQKMFALPEDCKVQRRDRPASEENKASSEERKKVPVA